MAKKDVEIIVEALRKGMKEALEKSQELENITTKEVADLLAHAGIVVKKSGSHPYSRNVFYKSHEGTYLIGSYRGKMRHLVSYGDMNKALDRLIKTGEAARRKGLGRRGTAVWKYQFFASTDAADAKTQQAKWDNEAAGTKSNIDALKAAMGLLERNMIPCAFQKHANGKATLTVYSEQGRDFLAFLRKLMA